MKWVLCGITFALAVVLAIGTAAIRAGNIRLQCELERDHRRIEARAVELSRLSMLAIEQVTPERLAEQLRRLIDDDEAKARRAEAARLEAESPSWQ